jgi:hypothetical protein
MLDAMPVEVLCIRSRMALGVCNLFERSGKFRSGSGIISDPISLLFFVKKERKI